MKYISSNTLQQLVNRSNNNQHDDPCGNDLLTWSGPDSPDSDGSGLHSARLPVDPAEVSTNNNQWFHEGISFLQTIVDVLECKASLCVCMSVYTPKHKAD